MKEQPDTVLPMSVQRSRGFWEKAGPYTNLSFLSGMLPGIVSKFEDEKHWGRQ